MHLSFISSDKQKVLKKYTVVIAVVKVAMLIAWANKPSVMGSCLLVTCVCRP